MFSVGFTILFLLVVLVSGNAVKKKVVFVSLFGYTPTTYMAMATHALPDKTAFNTDVDYRFVTYRDHASIVDEHGLDSEKVIYFNFSTSLLDPSKRMHINQHIADDNLHGLSALLLETAERNYRNEVRELWAMFKKEKPDLLVIDCLATRYSIKCMNMNLCLIPDPVFLLWLSLVCGVYFILLFHISSFYLNYSAIDLGHHLRIPFMVFYHTPILGLFGIEDAMHLPDNILGTREHQLTLYNRIQRIVSMPTMILAFSPPSNVLNSIRKGFGFITYNDPAFLVRDHPILVTSVFGFEYARPTSPLVKLVGMMYNNSTTSIQPSTPADSLVLDWLGAGEGCVVYVHFGTEAVPSRSVILTVLQGILGVTCRALVSIRAEILVHLDMPIQQLTSLHRYQDGNLKSSDDVMVVHWVSSRMILHHPLVKSFVCHGGAQSIVESIYALVPLLMLPQGGDRYAITARVLDLQIGLALDHHSMSVEQVQRALEHLLDPLHRANIQAKMTWLVKVNHYAGGGLEGAVRYIEEILEGGYEHLLPLPLPPLAIGGVDALLVLGLVLLAVIWGVWRGVWMMWRWLAPRGSAEKKTKTH
ncbi:hypothetical protein EON65_19705 [archaeon]|nr:MAG: hypothetical protein EON65_19705 [archaeon]